MNQNTKKLVDMMQKYFENKVAEIEDELENIRTALKAQDFVAAKCCLDDIKDVAIVTTFERVMAEETTKFIREEQPF